MGFSHKKEVFEHHYGPAGGPRQVDEVVLG
jgi:hypothetical protein